ncbi:hypothetical protein LguiA_036639 [Lonicera macranthoides]
MQQQAVIVPIIDSRSKIAITIAPKLHAFKLTILNRQMNLSMSKGSHLPPYQIVTEASSIYVQLKASNFPSVPHNSDCNKQLQVKWQKPPSCWVKCNVNASNFSNSSGYGGIIHSSNEEFIAGNSGHIAGFRSFLMAEIMGIREVLSWLKNIQVEKVLIKADSQIVVNALNRNEADSSSFRLVVDDCKLLVDNIKQCKVVFIHRSANGVAYYLARATISLSN